VHFVFSFIQLTIDNEGVRPADNLNKQRAKRATNTFDYTLSIAYCQSSTDNMHRARALYPLVLHAIFAGSAQMACLKAKASFTN